MTHEMNTQEQVLQNIIQSAQRLGVELNQADALQWLAAMTAAQHSEIVIDERSGTFGHRITMLDFSDEDLEHFRQLGRLVEFGDIPGKVETALALSGSAAQSKIQTYPGDADFFERVNILASTKEEACRVLGELMQEKAISTLRGPTYQLVQVRMGNYPFDMLRGKDLVPAGTPIAWTPEEVKAGSIEGTTLAGEAAAVTWEQAAQDPGWCKLDWVVADPVREQLVNASNMLDATWEAPDGTITPLDGYLDSLENRAPAGLCALALRSPDSGNRRFMLGHERALSRDDYSV
jgi:hypothetical protein